MSTSIFVKLNIILKTIRKDFDNESNKLWHFHEYFMRGFIIKVKELIDILKTYDPESEVRIASDEYGDIELEIQNVSENSIDGGPLIL